MIVKGLRLLNINTNININIKGESEMELRKQWVIEDYNMRKFIECTYEFEVIGKNKNGETVVGMEQIEVQKVNDLPVDKLVAVLDKKTEDLQELIAQQ
jgi:hypothetical protein